MKTYVVADEYNWQNLKESFEVEHENVTHWATVNGFLKLYNGKELVAMYPPGDWHGVYVKET